MQGRRRIMTSGAALPPGAIIDGSNAQALDVLFSSNDGEQLCIVHGQENWPDDGWTPIGIVVVPGTHDRYGDGSCGVISLVGMDYNRPSEGIEVTSSSQLDNIGMYWGGDSTTIGNNIFTSNIAVENTSSDFLMFQTRYGNYSYHNNTEPVIWPYYIQDINEYTDIASTAYDNQGSYVNETIGKSGCDFNGIRNTAAIYVKTLDSSQWTDSTIENINNASTTPAAACCGRFKTLGTKSFLDVYGDITSNNLNYGTPSNTKENRGFWYFPAIGELCYLPGIIYDFSLTSNALNQKYGNISIKIARSGTTADNRNYISSSEGGTEYSSSMWRLLVYEGKIERVAKNPRIITNAYCVRAFLRF